MGSFSFVALPQSRPFPPGVLTRQLGPDAPAWAGRAGPGPAGPGWAGRAGRARTGRAGQACPARLSGQGVYVALAWPGMARPARLAWPGPSEKQKIKNVKVSKMAATAAIFYALTFLIFLFESEGQQGKRAGLYLLQSYKCKNTHMHKYIIYTRTLPARHVLKSLTIWCTARKAAQAAMLARCMELHGPARH